MLRAAESARRGVIGVFAVVVGFGWSLPAGGIELAAPLSVRPELAAQLVSSAPGEALLVLVTGDTTQGAVAAVEAAGLDTVEEFDRFGIVAAVGPVSAVRAVHAQQGVRRVDANEEFELFDDVAHRATGVAQLRDRAAYPELRRQRRADKMPYDGSGVSIAVVDGGFDITHEQFVENGESKFDVHLRQACASGRDWIYYVAGQDPTPQGCSAWVPATELDDVHAGHGTVVAGVAAAYRRSTPRGPVSGSAPGAHLVGLATGASVTKYNAFSALNWVLEHHADPCGDGSCPPIRVVNNSYGLRADDEFGLARRRYDPDAPMSVVTSALVDSGVVVVFAGGNEAGNGTSANTSFLFHPQPGVLGVGSLDDGGAGNRDIGVAAHSSRGLKGDLSTYPDLIAPGVLFEIGCTLAASTFDCLPRQSGDGYWWATGTSIAAPYVAGVVAQLLEADPSLTPAEVEEILEDTAYQRFIGPDLLEADVYADSTGNVYGNGDHPTSFHAGHGLIDAVAALASIKGGVPVTPDPCPSRSPESALADPLGDVTLEGNVPSPAERPAFDIVGVDTSLVANPGGVTVVLSLDDLPDVEPSRQVSVRVLVDGVLTWVRMDRTPAGERFQVVTGGVSVDGGVDPQADTVTFRIRRLDAAAPQWAALYRAVTGIAQAVDETDGACPVWAP